MVVRFRRAISFPAPKSSTAAANPAISSSYRVRSASLPCRFHPLLIHLDEDVATLRFNTAALNSTASPPSPPIISNTIDQLGQVLASISDLLHHPQVQEPLRRLRLSPWSDRLLDDFLRLADIYGNFRSVLISLSSHQAEARAALRRDDPCRLSSAARALRRSARDLSRLASSARAIAKSPSPPSGEFIEVTTLAAAAADATAAVASASAAVFTGVAALSVSSTAGVVASPALWFPMMSPARFAAPPVAHKAAPKVMRIWWVADLLRWMRRAKRRSANGDKHEMEVDVEMAKEAKERNAAFDRLNGLEECIRQVESSGEKVFRALVNTRVALLNILTPTF